MAILTEIIIACLKNATNLCLALLPVTLIFDAYYISCQLQTSWRRNFEQFLYTHVRCISLHISGKRTLDIGFFRCDAFYEMNHKESSTVSWINRCCIAQSKIKHDDVIKWKNFPRNLPLMRGIHRSLVNSPHKGQWRRALSKQSWGWWLETPTRSLWRYCNESNLIHSSDIPLKEITNCVPPKLISATLR